jgi:hypothetical protein
MMSGRMRRIRGFGGHEREDHDTNGDGSAREKEGSAFHFGLLFSLAGMPACLLACPLSGRFHYAAGTDGYIKEKQFLGGLIAECFQLIALWAYGSYSCRLTANSL